MTTPRLPSSRSSVVLSIDNVAAACLNPKAAFLDPVLQTCKIACDAAGRPDISSHQRCFIFKAITQRGDLAIKVFRRPSTADLARRYEALRQSFASFRPFWAPRVLLYQDAAIRLPDGETASLLVMDWVDGQDIASAVIEMANDRSELTRMGEAVIALARHLERRSMAHMDAWPQNILWCHALKLIDFDRFLLPECQNLRPPSLRMHRDWQSPCGEHPYRSGGD